MMTGEETSAALTETVNESGCVNDEREPWVLLLVDIFSLVDVTRSY